MSQQTHLSLAMGYLAAAIDQLLEDDQDPTASALFAAVECLEIQSQLSELDQHATPVTELLSPTPALFLAADLLSRDGRPTLAPIAGRLRRIAFEVR